MMQVVCAIPLCFEGFNNFLILAVPKTVHSSSVLKSEISLTNLKDQTGSCSPVTLSSHPVCYMSDVCQPL
jgi:hypothetical protein